MGTSNHSMTVSATPARYDNNSIVALGYQHTKEHTVFQHAISACVQPIHARRGYCLDLLAGFMTGI